MSKKEGIKREESCVTANTNARMACINTAIPMHSVRQNAYTAGGWKIPIFSHQASGNAVLCVIWNVKYSVNLMMESHPMAAI